MGGGCQASFAVKSSDALNAERFSGIRAFTDTNTAPTAAQKWRGTKMQHCSSCAHCILDIKALRYCGVVVDKCALTDNLVLTPFIDGIMCKCYKKRFATPVTAKIKDEIKMQLIDANVSPTMDAVPVVRCGECRYWYNEYGVPPECLHPGGMIHPKQYYFCSNGARKDDLNG